jgi:multidrug resistance efflux pump
VEICRSFKGDKMLKRLLPIFVVIVVLAAGGYYGLRYLRSTTKADPPAYATVKRGLFIHEILDRGNVSSAKNVEVRCQVESSNGLLITYLIPEGTLVEEGTLLVKLDASILDENILRHQMEVLANQARLKQSQADLRVAELSKIEYLEGKFEMDKKTIENKIFTAIENVRSQELRVAHSLRLYERGYIQYESVQAELIELEKAVKAKEIAENELIILEQYTKEKEVTRLQVAIDTMEMRVQTDTQSLQLASDRLARFEDQKRRCEIKAPRDGQVVYPPPPRWASDDIMREGKKVNEREVLVILPDPTQMLVKTMVNEANVRLVKPGQSATIRLEAFPDQVFQGEVETVNDFPEPAPWGGGGSMSREYMTTIAIRDPPVGIKTGLTAQATIVVNEINDTLLLPILSVIEWGGKTYVITYEEAKDKWKKIEVKTGPANDKEVVLLEGLNEGMQVVKNAWAYREKVDLPKIEEKPEQEREESGQFEGQSGPNDGRNGLEGQDGQGSRQGNREGRSQGSEESNPSGDSPSTQRRQGGGGGGGGGGGRPRPQEP